MARLGRSKPAGSYSTVRPMLNAWSIEETLWYAVFDTATGNLLSITDDISGGLPGGMDYIVVADWPMYAPFILWDATLRLFVPIPVIVMIDRVTDLMSDASCIASWAAMSADQSQALQTRIRQMLGPYRWRLDYQDIDLSAGWGA
jgi:hypothetical protein